MKPFPQGLSTLEIYFDTKPDRYNAVIELINNELKAIATDGPRQIFFQKSLATCFDARQKITKENEYWLHILASYYAENLDLHTKYDEILETITPKEIQSFVKEFITQGNVIQIVMYPEK
jgi:zinc protease